MATRRSKRSSNWNSCVSILFFSVFFSIGTGLTWFLAVAPMMKSREAANWREVGCVIQHISVKAHHGDGTTYSPEVSFSYSIDGQPYTSKQFWFGNGSYGDRRAIERAISPYQAGGEYPCYVNPRNFSEAVLTRQVAAHAWLGWLFGGIFGLVGLGGMIAGLRSLMKNKKAVRQPSQFSQERKAVPSVQPLKHHHDPSGGMTSESIPEYDFDSSVCPIEEDRPDEPLILAPKASRVGSAIGAWIFSIIWNAIAWTIGYFVFQDHQWFAMIFIGVFMIVGIAAIMGSIYCTLQIFNPRTSVVCSQRNLYAGSEFEISWLHQRNTSSISELLIELVGEESATYRQGTTTRTDKKAFFKQTIVQTNEPTEISNGFRLVSLPVDTMHSFQGARNAIVWRISVQGKIRFWPDIHDEFSITIYPPPATGATNAEN
jgi:Protein of unknown function (DUF3592)